MWGRPFESECVCLRVCVCDAAVMPCVRKRLKIPQSLMDSHSSSRSLQAHPVYIIHAAAAHLPLQPP